VLNLTSGCIHACVSSEAHASSRITIRERPQSLIQTLRGRIGSHHLQLYRLCTWCLFPYPMAYKHQAAPCTTMCPSGSYYIEHHVYRHVFRPFREQHLRIPWLILRQTGIKSCILSICRRLICRAPCTCPQPGLKLPHLCHEAMKLSFGCSVLSHSTPSPC
jgi:hypothetical protein